MNKIFILFSICFIFTRCNRITETSNSEIVGSDTEYPFVSEMAKVFNRSNKTHYSVTSGGSSIGFEQLLACECSIANASRSINETELELAKENEMNLSEIVIAIDAIAIITHPKLGIDSLSTLQLISIFDGTFTNWKQVNGPDLPITIYNRDVKSGTFQFIKDQFCRTGVAKNRIEKRSNNEIIQAIETDVSGISYVGIGALREKNGQPIGSVWTVNLYTEGGHAFSPFQEMEAVNGNYPLVRPLFQYADLVSHPELKSFLRFELSTEGKDIIRKSGFYPITSQFEERNKRNGF